MISQRKMYSVFSVYAVVNLNTILAMLYEKESYALNCAMFEVHKHLGPGLLEKVYQEALAHELTLQNIPFEREKEFTIIYKGHTLTQKYIADFVCFDKIIVELKSVDEISDVFRAQVINYLKITGYKLALLQNFNRTHLTTAERLINLPKKDINSGFTNM